MRDQLPAPLVDPDVDLKDFPFTPMFRSRLFGSSFHAKASDGGWRAGVTLWLKSWDQTPAGSLPDDDVDLCRLAELGRDLKSWSKIKKEGLWGWIKCSDGRLYHKTVAEGVNEAWRTKLEQRWRTECGKLKKAAQRAGTVVALPAFTDWLERRCPKPVPRDTSGTGPGTDDHCPDVVPRETASKGREGKGREGIIDEDDGAREADPAVLLIQAFDAARVAVLGQEQARPWPFASDISTARKWLEAGADAELVRFISEVEHKKMREQPTRWPRALGGIERQVLNAIAVRKSKTAIAGTPPAPKIQAVETFDDERWRTNLRRLKEHGVWPNDIGPKPGFRNCRVPAHLQVEFSFTPAQPAEAVQ